MADSDDHPSPARAVSVAFELRAWRLVRCGHQRDAGVAERLAALGHETYAPVVRELRKVPQRKLSYFQRQAGAAIMRPARVPFLPGYVFARLPMRVPDSVFAVEGVIGLLARPDGSDLVLADAAIEAVRAREVDGVIPGSDTLGEIFDPGRLFVGDRVIITAGAFTFFQGKVAQLPKGPIETIDADTKLRIMIDLFGRKTVVELSAGQVEKL